MPQMKINQRGLNVGMTQKMLQREKINARLQRVRGETVPQRMNRGRL
jgi:hypothetical protein